MKAEVLTAWYIYKHPAAPWPSRVLAILIVAYVFSPVDLIPDFIPVLGYLDDLVLAPVGIYILVRVTPSEIVAAARAQARDPAAKRPAKTSGKFGLILVLLVWVLILSLVVYFAQK